VIVVYLSGIGPLTPPLHEGLPTPGDLLYWAALPYSATIGGQPAEVAFLGLTPGQTGLAQANILIPSLPPGPHTLVISIDGNASNAVEVFVA
jgi:uncharacterized protein (TIGR03437 family)